MTKPKEKTPEELLYDAIANNDIRSINHLMSDEKILNLFTQENECGQLIYHAGARYNNINIVALLLTKMSGLNNFASDTFVHACKEGNVELAKLLLDTEAASQQDMSLTHACLSGNIELVRLLLDRGANPRYEIPVLFNSRYNPALNAACSIGNLAIFDLLMENGAQIIDSVINPYSIAAENGKVDMLRHLFKHQPLDQNKVILLLRSICKADEPRLLDLLREHGYDVTDQQDIQTDDNIFAPHTSFFEELLCQIITHDSINILNTLKIDATNINIPCRVVDSYFPLYLACETGYVDLVEHFLNNGSNPKLANNRDLETPLHIACKRGFVDIVDRLLHSDQCDINAVSRSGNTALMDLLKGNNPLIGILDRLIIHGANLNYCDEFGESVLMTAVNKGQVAIVERLLGLDVNVNWPNNIGITPLMHAVERNHIEIVRLLLNHPCIDTSATNNDGLTAADLAQELPDILALLTEHNDKHSQDTSSSRPSM